MKKLLLPLILILHLFILSKLTFTAWPEMFSYPYLFSSGFTLYKDFILPYPPLLVFFLAGIFNIFGFTPYVLKILTWILILGIDLILFLILKKITKNDLTGILFLTPFVLLQSFLEGNMLWFDLATIWPLLAGFLFILKWLEGRGVKYLFLIGLFLSLAVLIKQIALIYFIVFGIFYIFLVKKIILREITFFLGGIIVVSVPFICYLLATNSILPFWNWSIFYPLFEWSKFPGYVNFAISKKYAAVVLLLLLPLVGFLTNAKKLFKDSIFILSLGFSVGALIAVYPRFSLFHLQPALAFTVVLFAVVLTTLKNKLRIFYLTLIYTTTLVIISLVFPNSIGDQIRFYTASEQKLAQRIQGLTSSRDKIFLLGLDSSLYVFSNRLPPKGWSDNFGWYLEIPSVQEWVLAGMEQQSPQLIFRKMPLSGQWYELGTYQPKKILDYIFSNYEKIKAEEGMEIWIRKN